MATQTEIPATVWTWAGAALGVLGAATVTEWLALGGLMVAIGGFVVNLWHKWQMVKLERERLERQYPKAFK